MGEIKLSAVYENYIDANNPEGRQTTDDFAAFENIYINRDAGEFTLDFNAKNTLKERTQTSSPSARIPSEISSYDLWQSHLSRKRQN